MTEPKNASALTQEWHDSEHAPCDEHGPWRGLVLELDDGTLVPGARCWTCGYTVLSGDE